MTRRQTVPEKVAQCAFCGKVRTDEGWVRRSDVEVIHVGFCPPCGDRQAQRQTRKHWQRMRALEARKARGYRADPDAVPWDDLTKGR